MNNRSLSRRSFIGGLAACGGTGLVAAETLPTVPPPTVASDPFPRRGAYERLSLNYIRINAGATRPFSLLHISDTHLTAAYDNESPKKLKLRKDRTQTFGGHQEEALRDSLAWAKDNVEFVLHTGDLIDWQSEANFALVKKYFGKDIVGCVGNHEYSESMYLSDPKEAPTEAYRALTRDRLAATFPFDLSFASRVVNGVNFITLDDIYGTVNAGQVKRFKAEAAKGLPIILAMHVPFYTDFLWQADHKFWFEWGKKGGKFTDATVPPAAGDYAPMLKDPVTRDFIAYLKKEPLLKAILAGHVHFTAQDRFSPTAMQYTVAPNFLFAGQEVLVI